MSNEDTSRDVRDSFPDLLALGSADHNMFEGTDETCSYNQTKLMSLLVSKPFLQQTY